MRYIADLRQVARGLIKQPGFGLVAVLTLALGIGANTAVFSVLNSVILAPLPYDQPGELVRVYVASPEHPRDRGYLSVPDALDVRDETGAFQSVGILFTYRATGGDLAPPGEPPRRIRLLPVSADYFKTLRATPLMGRTFAADEERDDVARVVLSHRLWGEIAHRDPSVVGRTIELDGAPHQVIGVMRAGFRDVSGEEIAAWVPLDLQRTQEQNRRNQFLSAIARLKPGVTVAEAQARVDAMTQRLGPAYREARWVKILRVVPLLDAVVGDSRPSVLILMGAAGLVLLIACLNVANLFLARSLGQSRDLAVRAALGADQRRLVVERLIESVAVAAIGGLIGSLAAFWGVKGLLAVSPASVARAEEVGFDGRLFGFALVTTVLTGLVFGAGPAWRASRADPTDVLREGSRGNTGGRASRRTRDFLVAAQVAIALILLAGAGTLMTAFARLQRVDLGFDPSQVQTFELNLPNARYADPAARIRFHQAFIDRLRALPGVERVGATSWLPANGHYNQWGYEYRGPDGSDHSIGAEVRVVDGDYLGALRIPILQGRDFVPDDGRDTAGVAVISRKIATVAYAGASPLGASFETGGRYFRIIGVAGDVAQTVTGEAEPQVYLSHRQFGNDRNWTLTYVVRAALIGEPFLKAARSELAALDPALVLFQPRPLAEVVGRHRAREQFTLLLMGVFAGVALSLATIGLYGVMAYLVTQRSREIGVRIALGASPGQVRGAILKHGLAIATGGVLIGVAGAVMLDRVFGSVLSGAPSREPAVFGAVVLLLALVALLASYLPARRATRVDPLEALRRE
jgi:putative ABC transport system permease protein